MLILLVYGFVLQMQRSVKKARLAAAAIVDTDVTLSDDQPGAQGSADNEGLPPKVETEMKVVKIRVRVPVEVV
jgi:hypothetical protein